MNFPDAVETDEHIFVHVGIEGRDWYSMEPKKARGKRRFIGLGTPQAIYKWQQGLALPHPL